MSFLSALGRVGEFFGLTQPYAPDGDERIEDDPAAGYDDAVEDAGGYNAYTRPRKATKSRRAPEPEPEYDPDADRMTRPDRAATSDRADREDARPARASNVVRMPSERVAAEKYHEIVLFYVRSKNDCPDIIQHVLDGKTVVLNMESVDMAEQQRVIDIITGSAFTISGQHVPRIAHGIYIFTPQFVKVTELETDLHATDDYDDADASQSRYAR